MKISVQVGLFFPLFVVRFIPISKHFMPEYGGVKEARENRLEDKIYQASENIYLLFMPYFKINMQVVRGLGRRRVNPANMI